MREVVSMFATRRNGRGNRRWPRRLAPTQRQVIYDVMRSAAGCATWLTLRELARLTRFGETSISAQLRHLRKPRCGGYIVEKRMREGEESASVVLAMRVWEYRLKDEIRSKRNKDRRTAQIR